VSYKYTDITTFLSVVFCYEHKKFYQLLIQIYSWSLMCQAKSKMANYRHCIMYRHK